MNDFELLSVIVPIFNSEKFLKRCIESIINQKYKNIELILVDDYSNDQSKNICQYYCKIDSRIKYYRLDSNKGVSFARNYGLKKVNGKYVTFVDSDDYVDENIYTAIINKINDVEMVIIDMIEICKNNKIQSFQKINSISENKVFLRKEIQPQELFEIAGSVWRNVYLNKIIKENEIEFPIGVTLSEDRVFNLKYISCIKRYIYISEPLYFRFVHPDSTVHKYKKDMFKEVLSSNLLIEDTVRRYWDENFVQPYYYIFCLSYIACVRNILRKENRNQFTFKYKSIRNLLENANVEKAFSICNGYSLFNIYRRKKIISIWIVQSLELYLTKEHNRFIKCVFGKILCELYKMNKRGD